MEGSKGLSLLCDALLSGSKRYPWAAYCSPGAVVFNLVAKAIFSVTSFRFTPFLRHNGMEWRRVVWCIMDCISLEIKGI